jgi:hypothetical protein
MLSPIWHELVILRVASSDNDGHEIGLGPLVFIVTASPSELFEYGTVELGSGKSPTNASSYSMSLRR